MTQKEKTDRLSRAQALVDLVSRVEGGYRVQSSRDPNTSYFVSKPNGRVVCTCSDFEKHPEDPQFECKHILAVREAHRLGKVNGNGTNKAQIDLEARAMFGDPEAARQLDAQAQGKDAAPAEAGTTSIGIPTEIPEPEEEILPTLEGPWEEAVQLESCLVCHAKAPADEMILVSVSSGAGLVCHTCYDGRKACAFCGTRLPIEQLITVPTSNGAGLACEGCYSKSRACSRCGDHFPIERMVAVREPGFFGYFCSECAREREEEAAQEQREAWTRELWLAETNRQQQTPPIPAVPTLAFSIARANEILASFGNAAIEKVAVKNRQGQVVKELFGYGLQYTLDAVNAAIGPDAWRYKLLEWRAIEGGKGALVMIELELWDGARWHSHGPMFGTTGLADEGDSFKGAIGDALKKSFAYWGIGNLAYRGELKPAR